MPSGRDRPRLGKIIPAKATAGALVLPDGALLYPATEDPTGTDEPAPLVFTILTRHPVPAVAEIPAWLLEFLPNPLLTTSQVDLLKADSVASRVMPGFQELNIRPSRRRDALYRPIASRLIFRQPPTVLPTMPISMHIGVRAERRR